MYLFLPLPPLLVALLVRLRRHHCCIGTGQRTVSYEGTFNEKVIKSIILKPLAADHATLPQMKAMCVPFHLVYASFISF